LERTLTGSSNSELSTEKASPATARKEFKVLAHLAYGHDAKLWRKNWLEGKVIGVNDELPYGYFHAEAEGCRVAYSEAHGENILQKLVRLGLRGTLGFDLAHAWKNRGAILASDVVWTHTESQHLGVMMLFAMLRPVRRPKVIAQSVWLFDRWRKLSRIKQMAYLRLLRKADVLTVLSPDNRDIAKRLLPGSRVELVLFGINAARKVAPKSGPVSQPVRVLALGNDRHRDWETLISALGNQSGCVVRIGSQSCPRKLLEGVNNIELTHFDSNDQLAACFEWADIMVIPLLPNFHASGISVLQEAALFGLPTICTRTGGLEAYFSDQDVYYVPPQDPAAIRAALEKLAGDEALRVSLARNAQSRMGPDQLSSRAYAVRHAELSRELLAQGA
jgi:glycosyltransferase involved in cell wall biosynthesis